MTTKTVAAKTAIDVSRFFSPFFLKIKNAIRGARAIPCGFVSIAIAYAIVASFGFDLRARMSERTRKNVYIASNCPQTAASKITAGLKV